MPSIGTFLKSKLLWGLVLGCLLGYQAVSPAPTQPVFEYGFPARIQPLSVYQGVLLGGAFGLLLGIMWELWLNYRRVNFPRMEAFRLWPRMQRRSLKRAAIGAAIVLVAWATWPFVSESQRKQIRTGMSKAEVLQILGRPSSRGRTHWVWSRWPPPAAVFVVKFSADERVEDSFTD
jgi:hypothetical protein